MKRVAALGLGRNGLFFGTKVTPVVISPNLYNIRSIIRNFSEDGAAKPFSRKKVSKTEEVGASESKQLNRYDFVEKVRKFIAGAKDAVGPMESQNKVFIINHEPDKLTVDLGENGMYTLEADYDHFRLICQTPTSGRFQYFYNNEEGTWLNDNDNHDVRGLFTRDMLRQNLIGCPMFN